MNNYKVKIYISYILLGVYLIVIAIGAVLLASNFTLLIIEVVSGVVSFTVLAGILAIYVPKIKSHFASIMSGFDALDQVAKIQVKWRVEGTVNDFRENMDAEVKGLLPYPMNLKWVKSGEEIGPYLDEKRLVVVVRMRPKANEQWNLASASLAYVSEALIHEIRSVLVCTLGRATDFAFTKKLLEDEGEMAARNYLVEHEIRPVITKRDEVSTEIAHYYNRLLLISEELLTRVYLREISNTAKRIAYPPLKDISDDILEFLEWSVILAERDPEERVPLYYYGKYLKIICILVAGIDMSKLFNPQRYVKRAREHMKKGVNGVYILARGNKIPLARIISNQIEKLDFGLRKVSGSDKSYIVKIGDNLVEAVAIVFRPAPTRMLKNLSQWNKD